ncbi:MAG: hypothetical protein J0M12_06860 [Deltaproteobacteria bacterium]|nr:hypothetical protein [Deltaproteobacteria bacterium]
MRVAAQPSSVWNVPIILLLAAGISVGLFVYARSLMRQNHIEPSTFFAGPVPPPLETLMSVRIEGGELGEFFDPQTKQKLSLLLVARPTAGSESVSVPGLIQLIDKDRLGVEQVSEVARIALKYASAQFSVLAAGKIAQVDVPIATGKVIAEQFETTKSAHYLMGVINLKDQQLLFLALKKGEDVDAALIGHYLEKVPGVAERVASASAPK